MKRVLMIFAMAFIFASCAESVEPMGVEKAPKPCQTGCMGDDNDPPPTECYTPSGIPMPCPNP